jgi:hypothetical protein
MRILTRLIKLEQATNKGRLSPPILIIPTESNNPRLYLEMMGKVEEYRLQGIEVKTITITRAEDLFK